MKRIVALACIVFVGSCGTLPNRAPPIVNPQGDKIALVWIQDDPDMPAEAILAGCTYWNPLKIRCERTMKASESVIQVVANKEKCEDAAHHKLAWAHPGGKIEMVTDCLKGWLGIRVDKEKMASVAAHEIGHELGIWDHVPSSCEQSKFDKEKEEYDKTLKLKTHPSGRKICGDAVMNPCEHGLPYLTEMDRLAFDIRDPDWRAVDTDGKPTTNWEGCILYPKLK